MFDKIKEFFSGKEPESLKVAKNKPARDLKFVCISDTHSNTDQLILPRGDVLIHAGDFTNIGGVSCLQKFRDFVNNQDFQYKIIVAGNHDLTLSELDHERNLKTWGHFLKREGGEIPSIEEARSYLKDFIYLENSGVEIEGLKVWGSPMSNYHPNLRDWGFTPKESDISKFWDQIPTDTDILITHSPPYGVLDTEKEDENFHWGSENLTKQLVRIKPTAHIFGHVHDPNGFQIDSSLNTLFVNAAICDNRYRPVNKPKVFTITQTGEIKIEPDS